MITCPALGVTELNISHSRGRMTWSAGGAAGVFRGGPCGRSLSLRVEEPQRTAPSLADVEAECGDVEVSRLLTLNVQPVVQQQHGVPRSVCCVLRRRANAPSARHHDDGGARALAPPDRQTACTRGRGPAGNVCASRPDDSNSLALQRTAIRARRPRPAT
eukprot:2174053-Rhodomonas_salina.2